MRLPNHVFLAKAGRALRRKAEGVAGRLLPLGETLAAMELHPFELHLELTNLCNANCVFCPYQFQERAVDFMPEEVFAKAQEGKPYVWGATGPDSYDCSGLTQAAWKAAGISLPRTTWDQVEFGTTVALSDIQPGDLVFFYDDISHVGLYLGDGMMIHAPKPGAYVREESIYYDGKSSIHSVVRPA